MIPAVVLASASRTRAGMLERAGVAVTCDAAAVDEEEVKRSLRADGAPVEAVAEALAGMKAHRVARRHPDALVIGADQMLECEGAWFDKPDGRAAARAQLLALRDRTHRLVSAAVVVRNGERLWHATAAATLRVRPFSDRFLDAYLDTVGDAVLHSVGAYQIEGMGVQLFSRVEGDVFTILGLPLLPMLGFLRAHGVVTE